MTTTTEKNNLTVEELIGLSDIILKSKRNLSEDVKQELYLYALEGAKHGNFGSLDIKTLINTLNEKLNRLILDQYRVNKISFIYTLYKKYSEDDIGEPIKKEIAQEIERFYKSKGHSGNISKYTQEIIDILFT